MNQAPVRFIRKNGKIIPIRISKAAPKIAAAGIVAAGHVAGQRITSANSKIKVNRYLDLTGLGLSLASGAVAASTFSGGAPGIVGGHAAAYGIDALGISANAASVAGRGQFKERLKQGAKQEARNFVLGNAVYAAGIVGMKRNREALARYGAKILEYGRKALRVT